MSPDVSGERFDELYVGGGEAHWSNLAGGAGDWDSSASDPANLGSPAGAKDLVEAIGAYTTHDGVLRLNVRGVRRDGSRWLKVMNATSGSGALLQDWAPAQFGPAQDVPTATAADQVLRDHLRSGPA